MKRFLHHFFVPHESNNHRARVLHHDSLLLIITFLFAGLIVIQGMHRTYPAVLGDSTSITTSDLLKYTNLEREANGLAPLNLNPELTHAAQLKAKDMFAKDYWAHVSPDGTTPWVWIRDSGYNYLYAGENLARGFDSSSDVVTAWMNSPEHRANLLSPNYTDIGFAVQDGTLTGTETTLVVQEFGSPYNSDGTVANTVPSPIPGSTSPTPLPAQVLASAGLPVPTITASGSAVGSIKIGQPSALDPENQQLAPALIDSNSLKRTISFAILGFFLLVLAIDAIVVERKQIVRLFSHNVDHMLFLLFILLAGIIVGRGLIL
jgi:hypothetical protein